MHHKIHPSAPSSPAPLAEDLPDPSPSLLPQVGLTDLPASRHTQPRESQPIRSVVQSAELTMRTASSSVAQQILRVLAHPLFGKQSLITPPHRHLEAHPLTGANKVPESNNPVHLIYCWPSIAATSNSQPLPTLPPPPSQNSPAMTALHPRAEAMLFLTAPVVRLICAFHD